MKKEDLQLIFKEIYNKIIKKNKHEIIKVLLKPLSQKYRKNNGKFILKNCRLCKQLDLFGKYKVCKDCKSHIELKKDEHKQQYNKVLDDIIFYKYWYYLKEKPQ